MTKQLNIVLFGPPGAGKGTQSENLINKYGLVHLSTGDILRGEISRGSELGMRAKAIMDRGELVSDAIVIDMIEVKLDANPNAKGFIFDGFPRTEAQATALDDLLQKKGSGIAGMLALEVDNEELVKRLLLRGQDSGRADDKDENIIRNRINEYTNKTLPLKNFYNEQGKFHSINGIGSKEEIFKAITERITFLNAEMDLTALESDIEHLDLTINDYEEANDIAPELLLEIDAIKRAEAEEAEEEKEAKRQAKRTSTSPSAKKSVTAESKSTNTGTKAKVTVTATPKKKPSSSASVKKTVKKAKPAKKATKPTKKIVKKATKKAAPKKKITAPKKGVKKVAPKKVKKVAPKKLVSKKAVAKKKITKKVIAKKKALPKKSVKKPIKKAIKKSVPKKVTKKIVKKTVKKVAKKVVAKKKKR
jgi:adenylate kinase